MHQSRAWPLASLLLAASLRPALASSPATNPDLIEAARARGEIDEATSRLYLAYALLAPDRLPRALAAAAPWEGTLDLLRLRKVVRTMPASAARAEIETLFHGICSQSTAPLANVTDTPHFHIEWDPIAPPLTIDDYIAALETAWVTVVDRFGWAAPPVLASNPPPGNRYHVRISGGNYVSAEGDHAGFVGDNPNTPWDDGSAYASCMSLSGTMSAFPDPRVDLGGIVAHEFTHALQLGYGVVGGAIDDPIFLEGAAHWMVDEVARGSNWIHAGAWPDFADCMGAYHGDPYGYWVVFRAMTEPFGVGVAGGGEQILQELYEQSSRRHVLDLPALDRGCAAAGTTLAEAFHAAAVTLKFLRPCGGGYIAPFCLDEGPDLLARRGSTPLRSTLVRIPSTVSGALADHHALDWVGLPADAAYEVRLRADGPGGDLRASVVCDTGSELVVRRLATHLLPGETRHMGDVDASGCASIVAVLTNQAQTEPDPGSCAAHGYLLSVGPPSPRELRLLAVRDRSGSHVDLLWEGGSRGFTIWRGPAPEALGTLAVTDQDRYRDPDAVRAPEVYYYRVE